MQNLYQVKNYKFFFLFLLFFKYPWGINHLALRNFIIFEENGNGKPKTNIYIFFFYCFFVIKTDKTNLNK